METFAHQSPGLFALLLGGYVLIGVGGGVLFTWKTTRCCDPYTAGDLLLGIIGGAVAGPLLWFILGLGWVHAKLDKITLIEPDGR